MNVKAIWLPLALLASISVNTADAATSGPPDLCAELDEYGDPARCDAVGPDMAPWWNDDVCCDERLCFEPGSSGCAAGTDRYWCESVILHSDGSLACVYEVPAFCDVYPCGPADITAPPLKNTICCFEVGCYDHEGGLCGGSEIWCDAGVSNADGTVTCLDGED